MVGNFNFVFSMFLLKLLSILNDYNSLMQSKIKFTILSCFLIIIVLSACYLLPKPYSDSPYLGSEVNVCLHVEDYSNRTLSYLKDLNVNWVRTDWVLTPDNLIVEYANNLEENSINLLAIIDINTFNQQSPTLQEWNYAITEIVCSSDFGSVDAVEIWNEPNGNASIAPETYYLMLKSAYVIIKNYTSIPVVFAGVSPNVEGWQTYLNDVFVNDDVDHYYDYMGIHLYDDSQTNFNTLGFVKGLNSKPIWLTETGKPSTNNNETEQAQYLQGVYETLISKVSKIFIYEIYDGQGAEPPKENYFGLLTINETKKEAYIFVKTISDFNK